MSAQIRANIAPDRTVVAKLLQLRFGALALVSAVPLVLAGCANPPAPPLAGADPADPGARVPRVGYRSTVGGYTSQRPVEPRPWGEQNERVAPLPRP